MKAAYRTARGFALIEVLVSVVVVAFGMLALASMQMNLSRNADVAKQRSEAVRLAQEKMECLRAYTQITTSATASAARNCMGALLAVDTWDGMANVGSDPLNPISSAYSNTTYTRSWAFDSRYTSASSQRPVTVTVTWTDRAGEVQTYQLSSVISQSNPDNAGELGFPLPQNTNLKRPKNRSLNIPVAAISLGNGQSAYQLNANLAVVFSDDSGYVVQRCNTTVTAANYATLVANGDCTTFNAYIVAGYISGDSTWDSNANSLPTGINTSGVTSSGTISCAFDPTLQAVNQNTGTAITGSNQWRYYLCVVPVTAGGTWSGTIRLAGMTTNNSGSRWRVCRFEHPASALFPNSNERNVQPYTNVSTSLDSQNYYVSSGTCPSGSITYFNGPSAQTTSYTTVQHQDCRGTPSATNCPTTFTGP
jgi:type IV pilus modification protein PilV